MKKKTFYTEFAYIFGILALALGTALSERANFGMSMVVAPAYILHLKLSEYFGFFSFGMAEYTLQAVLLIALAVVMRKFKKMYLFSFVTAVIYGFALDGAIFLIGLIPDAGMSERVVFFICGMLLCSLGVSFVFHTYIAPEAYELFVKEITVKSNMEIHRVKIIYDVCSCIISIAFSFAFWGFWQFRGVQIGTVICALTNGWIIGWYNKLLENKFEFNDGLKLRKFFE